MSSLSSVRTIPVGRDDEIQILLDAYERNIRAPAVRRVSCASLNQTSRLAYGELVSIRGKSGTGKTVLATSLQHQAQEDGGFFLTGKFGLAILQDPYAVFVSIFDNFAKLLLEASKVDETRLLLIRSAIQEAVGSEGKLLTNMIPAVEKIVGRQDDASDVKGFEAIHRFRFLFCKVCHAVSKVVPLVLFFDDLQWSDTASLQLIQALIQYRATTSDDDTKLLLIGAYREEGIGDGSENTITTDGSQLPFLSHLKQFNDFASSGHLKLTKILLENLTEELMIPLLQDFLRSPGGSFTRLSAAIFPKCQGNPFYTLQVVKAMVIEGCTLDDDNFDPTNSNFVSFSKPEAMTDELLRRKLNLLPAWAREVLQIAACMGDEIDETAISVVLNTDVSAIELSIQAAAAEGHLMLHNEAGRYRFSHDRIRQAALYMIANRKATSYEIGYRLWTQSYTDKIFVVARLLNNGTDIMTDRSERYRAAALNLEAGITAASLAAFPDAACYLAAGIAFLKGGVYWFEQYDLALSLFNAAADSELCTQNFDRALELVREVLDHAKCVGEQIPALVTKINCLGQRGQLNEAIKAGISVLNQLDEPLPLTITKRSLVMEICRVRLALLGLAHKRILTAQPMEDKNKLAATHILLVLQLYAFQATSLYAPLIGARLIRLCLSFGFHKNCALGFVTIGWVLCGRNRKEGFRLGALALSIIEKARARELLPRVHMFFYGMIHHWRCRLRDSIEPLRNAVRIGLEIGDIDFAMTALQLCCTHSLNCGLPLHDVEKIFLEAIQQMRFYKQESTLKLANPHLQFVLNLQGRAPNPKVLEGEVVERFDPLENPTTTPPIVRHLYYFLESNLAFRFADYEVAHQLCEQQRKLQNRPFAVFNFVISRQIEALVAIACARTGLDKKQSQKIARLVIKQFKAWAVDCPENFLCRKHLLYAELQSLKRHRMVDHRIETLYDLAIDTALEEGFTQEAALASELAGDYMKRQGNVVLARNYWERAHGYYLQWGATSKAAHLVIATGISTSTSSS